MQEVAMNLTEKNRKLRKKHAQLGEKVAALMGVDLVRQRDKWKEGVKELRAVFDGLEKQGIAVTRDWKAHWDHQVRKAFRSGQLFRKWQVVYRLVSNPIQGDWRLSDGIEWLRGCRWSEWDIRGETRTVSSFAFANGT